MRSREFITDSRKVFPDVIKDIVSFIPFAVEIWFYGSRATGKFRKTSDWDILVIVPDEVDSENYLETVLKLQEIAAKYKNFDIQPAKNQSNLARVAREEGQLIWKKTG